MNIKLSNIPKFLADIIDYILATIVASITLMIFTEVILRNLFNRSLLFGVELSRILFIVMVFLGGCTATYRKSHIALSLFLDILPPKITKMLLVIVHIICIATMIFFVYAAWLLTINAPSQRTPMIGMPRSFVQFPLVIAGSIMAFYYFIHLVNLFKSLYKKENSS